MLSKKMGKALNEQINAEMYSSYLYLSMSAWFEGRNLPGFAQWMKVQAGEENNHAMKFYRYVFDRLGKVELAAIEGPPTEWESPLAVFEEVFAHEQRVTAMIHDLADLAAKEKDLATQSFLKWFIDEQVEEEASADAVVRKLRMMGDFPGGVFMMDRELGSRGK